MCGRLNSTMCAFRVENQKRWVCWKSGGRSKFMTEIPMPNGSVNHEISDTSYLQKLVDKTAPGASYFDDEGAFYIDGYLR